MTRVLLLAGGTSSERAVSLRSGAAVADALRASGHSVTVFDPAQPIATTLFSDHDVIFPIVHGTGGEDGVVQSQLETLGINSFVGSDSAASALCFDKWRYKSVLNEHDIPTPSGALITSDMIAEHPIAQAPFVLKPFDGGSSVDTYIVRDTTTADFVAMQASCQKYGSMLLETLVEGVEITVGILGDTALPVIEIIPPANEEFDYENKYNGSTQELCPPQHISAALQSAAQDLAVQIHLLTGCRDYSRTDMIIADNGSMCVLETNTIPGMTDQSLLPKAALAAGITMPQLVDMLVALAAAHA